MASILTVAGGVRPEVPEASGPVALDFYGERRPPCRVLEPRPSAGRTSVGISRWPRGSA